MKLTTRILISGLALTASVAAGVVYAKPGVEDPTVKARMELMGTIGMNTKILGDMAGGKSDFDAAAAGAAKSALAAAAAGIPAAFETEADDPVSEARPDVWMNWEGFSEKAKDLEDAANAMDVTSAASIGAGMGAIGGSCKACHSDFRAKK